MPNAARTVKKRLAFNTTINPDIAKDFKEYCTEIGMPLNVVLEAFMRQFASGEFQLKFGKNNALEMELEE